MDSFLSLFNRKSFRRFIKNRKPQLILLVIYFIGTWTFLFILYLYNNWSFWRLTEELNTLYPQL